LELASPGCACRPLSDLRQSLIVGRCQRPISNFSRSCVRRSLRGSDPDSRRNPSSSGFLLRTNFQPFLGRCIFRLYLLAATGLRQASTFRLLPSDPVPGLRRSPHPRALPSDPVSNSRRNPRPPALPFNPTSDSSSELAFSDCTFLSTANLRRPSTFRLCPPSGLRLSPAPPLRAFPSHPAFGFRRNLHPPVLSATQLSFSVGVCILRRCRRSPADLRRLLIFRRCRRPTFRHPSTDESSDSASG